MSYTQQFERYADRHERSLRDLAGGLGWFSLALGAAEVMAPRALARGLGLYGHERLIFLYGVREIVAGVGVLTSRDPTPWVWSRVAGDGLDLATLASGMHEDNPERPNLVAAITAVAGVTLLDLFCASALSARGGRASERAPRHRYGRNGRRPGASREVVWRH